MAAELSDAEVFGTPAEMTDAQVFGQPQPEGYVAADGSYVPPQAIPGQEPPPGPPAAAPPTGVPVAVGDTVVSPDDVARVNAPPSRPPITSLSDLRDRIHQGDISTLKWLAPTPDAGPIERGLRYAAMTGEHLAAGLAQVPINVLMGIGQGTQGYTIDPATNNLNLTPEALQAAQVLSPGGGLIGGRDVQFSEANAFKRDPPSFLESQGDMRPMPVTLNELNAAINRVPPEQYGPPAPPANQMAPTVASDGSLVPPPEPAPQPAGAAPTPASELGMTPKQELAYRSTAEGQKLLEAQQPGIADPNQYVPGVQPNSAEIEQTVQASRELKLLNQQTPALGQEAVQLADANNTARQNQYAILAGSKVQLQAAKDALEQQDQGDLAATWAAKQPVDPQPVLDTAQQILSGDDGRRQAVRSRVQSVVNNLYDDSGNLITDPQILYGVRKDIGDMLSKEGIATDPLAVRAKASLMQLQDSLTGVISAGAPYFRQYLANHAASMRPINAMQVLQDAEPGLYGSQNRMEYGRVQRFMKDVVDDRQSNPISPYNGLTDEQMQGLWGLRDDLRRSSRAVELARAQGSDSVQNLGDILRGAARSAVPTATGTVLGTAAAALTGSPTVGAVVGTGVRAGTENFLSGRAEADRYRRGMQMLYPQNALMPQPPTLPPP